MVKRTCTTFVHNVRKQGDLTDESSERIVAEYRRFLYLKAIQGGAALTPPECIDEAWHLHLARSENYAQLERTLGVQLPHLRGLDREQCRALYADGHAAYVAEFGAAPPSDIWPSPAGVQTARTGAVISLVGLAIWGMGCFVGLPMYGFGSSWPVLLSGFVLFLGGGFYGGVTTPQTISRCG